MQVGITPICSVYWAFKCVCPAIVIAIAEPGRNGELRNFGTITNDLQALEKAIHRIRKAHPEATLEFAYEAGP
jgi:hypothetical protein